MTAPPPSEPSELSAGALDSALHSAPSAPAAPDLDHLFAHDDEPESQDGGMLSAGKVLSQPVEKKSPASDFEDDDEDEETRVLDARELGFARDSRRVDASLKSALRSSIAPPPPPSLGSRPTTMAPVSRMSAPPPMSVPSIRPPAAMPPPSGPPASYGPPSRRLPPAAPAPSGIPGHLSAPMLSAPPPMSPGVSVATTPPAAVKTRWPLFAVAAAVLAALGTWFLLGSKGDLLVTVSGPANAQVNSVTIFVDGQARCSQSPCKVEGLKPGSHSVRAEAPGHAASADQAVAVESGASAAYHIQLQADRVQPQLTVTAKGAGLRVLVDGRDRGTAPVEVSGLSLGEHTVRVEGPGFDAIEQTVTVSEGVAQLIGPLSPKLLKGSLRLELGENADGASVFVNGKSMRSLPVTLELDAGEQHKVLVRKGGFDDFEKTVSFSAEEPKVDLTINLSKGEETASADNTQPSYARRGGGGSSANIAAGSGAASKPAEPASDSKPDFLSAIKGNQTDTSKDKTSDSKPTATGNGTLNINSVPPTTVLLDGRPLGKTPKAGVSVPAGSHTITFVHSDKGRKTVKVTVPGGGSKTVSVRL